MKKLLTIAGSDSGGGAGIQADLKTFSALGSYGMSVITAVTAQNTVEVKGVEEISPQIVKKQIDAVFEDIGVDAVKIGMLSGQNIIQGVVKCLEKWQPGIVVLDPVMVSGSGHRLLNSDAENVLIEELFPLVKLVTPNLAETSVIVGKEVNSLDKMEKAAAEIYSSGSDAVLIKGGHLKKGNKSVDILFDGCEYYRISRSRLDVDNTHGTGCTYSSAITTYLAQGDELSEAVEKARDYLHEAINQGMDIGKGNGPVHHFHGI